MKSNNFYQAELFGSNSIFENAIGRPLYSSTGEILPGKLYDPITGEHEVPGVKDEYARYRKDFDSAINYEQSSIFLERGYSEYKDLPIRGNNRVKTPEDVAYLFKALEDEAAEHIFLLHRFEDDSFMAQHVSMGGVTMSMFDYRLTMAPILELKPKHLYLVHNHPSGNLIASKPDRTLLKGLRDQLKDTGIIVQDGIILNLRSGKFLTFTDEPGVQDDLNYFDNQSRSDSTIKAYSFNKLLFAKDYHPEKIFNNQDVAAFLSTQRFGLSAKRGLLVLNNANQIVAKLILSKKNNALDIAKHVSKFGGTATIFFGSEESYREIKDYEKQLSQMNIALLDSLVIEKLKDGKSYRVTSNQDGYPTDLGIHTSTAAESKPSLTVPFDRGTSYKVESGLGGEFDLKFKDYNPQTDTYTFKVTNPDFDKMELKYNSETVQKVRPQTKNLYDWDYGIRHKLTPLEKEVLEAVYYSDYQQRADPVGNPVWWLDESDVNMKPGQLAGAISSTVKKNLVTVDKSVKNEETIALTRMGFNALLENDIDIAREHYQSLPPAKPSDFEVGVTLKRKTVGDEFTISEKDMANEGVWNARGERGSIFIPENTAKEYVVIERPPKEKQQQTNINNQKPSIMETPEQNQTTQQAQNADNKEKQMSYLEKQITYLGFTPTPDQLKELSEKVHSNAEYFNLNLSSDKTHFDNKMDYTLNFGRGTKGGVFLNSYEGKLTKKDGEELTHRFGISRDTAITAKQALNLLEGRAVKTQLANKETGELQPVFIKLKLKEPKTDYGNFKLEVYHKNYGIDVNDIVGKSPLMFDNEDHKDKTIKSLERGNIVAVKFEQADKTIKGNAVLNPAYKTINLYDSHMNRLNTNKPQTGQINDSSHRKNNVKQHGISRGI